MYLFAGLEDKKKHCTNEQWQEYLLALYFKAKEQNYYSLMGVSPEDLSLLSEHYAAICQVIDPKEILLFSLVKKAYQTLRDPQKESIYRQGGDITEHVSHGNLEGIKNLITLGANERPLHSLFLGIHPSHFTKYDLMHINEFKKKILAHFSGETRQFKALENECKIAALLLSSPSPKLDSIFEKKKDDPFFNKQFLPFLAWMAANNRADLLEYCHIRELFQRQKPSIRIAIAAIAATFHSIHFLTTAIQKSLLEKEAIKEACCVAAARGDNEFLMAVLKRLNQDTKNDVNENSERAPLFWAIRHQHNNVVKFLLAEEHVPPHCSSLILAANGGNTDTIKLLLQHGANIHYQSSTGWTALHCAASWGHVDVLKCLISAGADINADKEGDKPLALIKNKAVYEEIQQFLKERESATFDVPPLLFSNAAQGNPPLSDQNQPIQTSPDVPRRQCSLM